MNTEFSPPHQLNTAVLFLVFNRPETTKQVFAAIIEAKPPRLYIAADGARTSKEGEAEKVNAVREFIMQNIDWDCEVKTLFRDENLGCKYAVSSAIDWFFENEEMGIILEDDCVPQQSFFWFCEKMLFMYENDMRIGHVSGFNFGYKCVDLKYDYFFSKYAFVWGWATWRRAWNKYDIKMRSYDETKKIRLYENYFKGNLNSEMHNFERVHNGTLNTWDYQWSYTCLINNFYTIVPAKNLITNIGFGEGATHTTGDNPYKSSVNEELDSDTLVHPNYMIQLNDFYSIFEKHYTFSHKLKRKFKKVVGLFCWGSKACK